MSPRNPFDTFCQEAIDLLRQAEVPFLVIGGLAVVAVGEPRTTADVDVVAFVSMKDADALIPRAQQAGFAVAANERQTLVQTGTLRFRKGPWQLDVIVASLPFEDAARRRAVDRKLFGRLVPLPTPEDLLVFKLLAGRDKDLLDAAGIVRRHDARLDYRYVEETLQAVCELAEDDAALRRLADIRRRTGRE